jgi:hypothetical protein
MPASYAAHQETSHHHTPQAIHRIDRDQDVLDIADSVPVNRLRCV